MPPKRKTNRKKKPQKGGNILKKGWDAVSSGAKALHDTAKKRKIVSGTLKDLGYKNLGNFVDKQWGYGSSSVNMKGRGEPVNNFNVGY